MERLILCWNQVICAGHASCEPHSDETTLYPFIMNLMEHFKLVHGVVWTLETDKMQCMHWSCRITLDRRGVYYASMNDLLEHTRRGHYLAESAEEAG